MDIRRIVRSGQTSYTISLPIDWIKKNKLDRKDFVFLKEKDNKLIISLKGEKIAPLIGTIETEKKNQTSLEEEVAQKYQRGATSITFLAGSKGDGIQKIEQIMQHFPGFEMQTKEENKITYKDLFDPEMLVIDELLRKQDAFLRIMGAELMQNIHSTQHQITITITANYLNSLRRQHLLLNRQILRRESVGRNEISLLLASRALLQLGMRIRDFIAALNLMDKEHVTENAFPEFKQYQEHYIQTMGILFSKNAGAAINHKEKLLGRIESLRAKVRHSQAMTLLIGLEYLLSMYDELIYLSELVGRVMAE